LALQCKAPTPRDNPILQLSANGKSVEQIALELGLSTKTIEAIRRHIMEKTKIDNLVGLN
jgi:DNA-binding NarL/FixJ family response regulator